MAEIEISDEMMEAFQGAFDACPQYDDSGYCCTRAGLAAALAGRLLPSGGEVSVQYTVIATGKDGRPMPGLMVHHTLEGARGWKTRLEGDRTVRGFSLAIHQRSAYEWIGGPIREAYGPWSPVLSDNSEGESSA